MAALTFGFWGKQRTLWTANQWAGSLKCLSGVRESKAENGLSVKAHFLTGLDGAIPFSPPGRSIIHMSDFCHLLFSTPLLRLFHFFFFYCGVWESVSNRVPRTRLNPLESQSSSSSLWGYVKCHDDIISYFIYLVASSIILSPFQKRVLSAFFFFKVTKAVF